MAVTVEEFPAPARPTSTCQGAAKPRGETSSALRAAIQGDNREGKLKISGLWIQIHWQFPTYM